MTDIVNPGKHEHRPTVMNGQRMCMDCNMVLIDPILSHDDERLKHDVYPPEDVQREMWFAAIKSVLPKPLDWILIELSNRLGMEWPDWIDQLADEYEGDPPHTKEWSDADGELG